MVLWKDDKELFALARKELFTALVGDVLDKLGYLHQFLPPQIKPVSNDMVVIGRAMPVLEADVFGEVVENTRNPVMHKPFGIMFEALDDLKEDEVYICTGSSHNYALWGGLMSTRAQKIGAAGAIVNGFSRDTNEILRLGFPTFSVGSYAQDQGPRGKVIDFRISIEWGGVRINPGDIIFGDLDGVIVIPQELEMEAFAGALEKARGEKQVLKALQDGMSTVDAFKKFGIM
jgi:regulator of RNase E activity RraA